MNAIESSAKILLSHLEVLQEIVNEHILAKNKPMTAKTIYSIFIKKVDTDIKETNFCGAFSASVRLGRITGVEGVRKVGYRPAMEVVSEAEESSPEDTTPEGGTIMISDHQRLIALDKLNWGYQVRKNENWQTEGYYSNATSMLHSLARKLLDKQLKGIDSIKLIDLIQHIEQAEKSIAQQLSQVMNRG
jgi:hypothetical protein